jgi:hypothetical protein
MSTAIAFNPKDPDVHVLGGTLQISNFVETDPTVVRVLDEADDKPAELHRILVLGASVSQVTTSTVGTINLTDTIERLTESVEDSVDNAVGGIAAAARALLDGEDGQLPKAFADFRTRFEAMLGQHFDPDKKTSLVGKFEELLHAAADEQTKRLNRALDPHDPDSLVGRLRDDVVKTVKEESADLAKQVQELKETIATTAAASSASKAMFNKTTAKGFKFEDVAEQIIGAIAAGHGDLAVRVSTELGSSGTKDGDEVVTINPEDTRGEHACVLWEFKDKKMSLKAILDELDKGIANRDACVGIAVFGTEAYAPTTVPFMTYGNKAILVVDKDEPDAGAFRLAYMFGRWVARRALGDHADELDVARVESLIDDAQRAVARIAQVRKCHSTAKKGIEDAAGQVDALVHEVEVALDGLRKEIDNG